MGNLRGHPGRAAEADDPTQPQWLVEMHGDVTTSVIVRTAVAGAARRAKAKYRADYGDGDAQRYGLFWPRTERLTDTEKH